MEDVKELSGEIIYVTTPERAINYKWEKNSNKLSREIQIVSIEDIQNTDMDVFDNKRILLNTLLVKHPFIPNKYIEIEYHFKDEKEFKNNNLYYRVLKKISLTHYIKCNEDRGNKVIFGKNRICHIIEVSYIIKKDNIFISDKSIYHLLDLQLPNLIMAL